MTKKKQKPKKNYRLVRVDSKTIIEVAPGISDEEAVANFIEKISFTKPVGPRWKKKTQNL